MKVISIDKRLWVENRFRDHKNSYDLTFFRATYYSSETPPTLYICDGRREVLIKQISGLPEILDYLKERLTEEQFLEVQKVCFNYI